MPEVSGVNFDLLVIGAGPYGVATAAYVKSRGLSLVVCGRLQSFCGVMDAQHARRDVLAIR